MYWYAYPMIIAGFQKKRISDLENGFQKDLDVLKEEFDKER